MTTMNQSRLHIPFSKDERIIIALVVLAHLAFIVPFNFGLTPKPPNYLNDERVMANLLPPDSPAPPKQSAPPAPRMPVEAPKPTPTPSPKPEVKKAEKTPTPAPTPAQSTPTPAPPTSSAKSSESTQSATVAPSTGGGGVSGTPIQTDIGKLIVVYQPDADPYYPSFSKRAGEQGEVVVRLIIDETGVVEDARLLQSSSYPRLDRAAMEIGKRYRFKPFLINGSPTKISTNLLIKFNLKSP
jgi:periplasmic protein TonB